MLAASFWCPALKSCLTLFVFLVWIALVLAVAPVSLPSVTRVPFRHPQEAEERVMRVEIQGETYSFISSHLLLLNTYCVP